MKVILIVRFHYEKDSPRFEWRFNYFKNEVLPKILDQTYQDFDIGIRCNAWHNDLFKSLSDRIIPFQVKDEEVKYKTCGNKTYFFDFTSWENVIGLEKYDIQIGLDSDDFISPDYVQTIHETVLRHIRRNGGKSLHISFQPEIYNTITKYIYPIGVDYSPTDGSAFMALYQSDKENYHFIYECSHHVIGKLAEKSITMPKGKCWASVTSGFNESTGV